MVDARLPDGSRVNAIIPPLALDGPALSIRRFGTGPLTADALIELKSVSPEMLESACRRRCGPRISILISGGTGAGKTTFLNMLSQVHSGERAHRHHRGCGGIADCSRRTWCGWRPGRPTWKARAPCGRDNC